MTDRELDRALRRALLDGVKADEAERPGEEPPFRPSRRYERSMAALAKDPLKWLRARERPAWKRALRQAAAVLLVLCVGFAGVMAAAPSARAAVVRWFVEWNETRITFYYSGDEIARRPDFVLTALPEGYEEALRDDFDSMVDIVYRDSDGNVLSFFYMFMEEGGLVGFDITNEQVVEVTVNGMDGLCLITPEPDTFNTLTWIDEARGVQFDLSGVFSPEELLEMAESVVPLD